jgi:asparagine synthase (glutamine-hydrolysing)
MCGIFGFVDYNKSLTKEQLTRSTDSMILRGPDAGAVDFFKNTNYNVGLGHRRLAILDLDERSNQPFYHNEYIIVFNGEIYNFKDIKKDLETLGHIFNTTSDTEVIIKAYQEWNDKCFERMLGMFAIGIYNSDLQEIILVRDRIGVKPLYIYNHDGIYVFSSESRAINILFDNKLEINQNALLGYFSLGYVPSLESIYLIVNKIEPGTITKINLVENKISTVKFWDIEHYLGNEELIEDNINELELLLEDAIGLRTVADVEIGSFLSGGYDSSYVTKILQDNLGSKKLNSYTAGFYEKFDEAPHAEKVANHIGTNHKNFYIEASDVNDILENYAVYFDEPFSDDAALPMLYLSRAASSDSKVVISADGGDEIFAGYSRYSNALKFNDFLSKFPTPVLTFCRYVCSFLEPILFFNEKARVVLWRFINIINADKKIQLSNILFFADRIPDVELQKVLTEELLHATISNNYFFDTKKKISPLKHILCIDFKEKLVNQMLVKVDKSTMGASIEGREPLLDHRLFEFMYAKNDEAFIYKGVQKNLFKSVISKKFNNSSILDKPKMGFNTPIYKWLREDYRVFAENHFKSINKYQIPYLDEEKVLKYWNDFKNGQVYYQNLIWRILIYILWFKQTNAQSK